MGIKEHEKFIKDSRLCTGFATHTVENNQALDNNNFRSIVTTRYSKSSETQ